MLPIHFDSEEALLEHDPFDFFRKKEKGKGKINKQYHKPKERKGKFFLSKKNKEKQRKNLISNQRLSTFFSFSLSITFLFSSSSLSGCVQRANTGSLVERNEIKKGNKRKEKEKREKRKEKEKREKRKQKEKLSFKNDTQKKERKERKREKKRKREKLYSKEEDEKGYYPKYSKIQDQKYAQQIFFSFLLSALPLLAFL